jgi:hypothetical protein
MLQVVNKVSRILIAVDSISEEVLPSAYGCSDVRVDIPSSFRTGKAFLMKGKFAAGKRGKPAGTAALRTEAQQLF